MDWGHLSIICAKILIKHYSCRNSTTQLTFGAKLVKRVVQLICPMFSGHWHRRGLQHLAMSWHFLTILGMEGYDSLQFYCAPLKSRLLRNAARHQTIDHCTTVNRSTSIDQSINRNGFLQCLVNTWRDVSLQQCVVCTAVNVFDQPTVASWWFHDTVAAPLVVGLSPLRVLLNGTRFQTLSWTLLCVPTASDWLWKLIF